VVKRGTPYVEIYGSGMKKCWKLRLSNP